MLTAIFLILAIAILALHLLDRFFARVPTNRIAQAVIVAIIVLGSFLYVLLILFGLVARPGV